MIFIRDKHQCYATWVSISLLACVSFLTDLRSTGTLITLGLCGAATRHSKTIFLDGEPLLCQHRQILGIATAQETSSQQLRRKRKATEKSRQEHWKAFEVSLRRKKRQNAGRKSQKRRVQRSKTSKTRACLLPKATGEIDAGQRILRIMEDEEREHKLQRSQLLKEASRAPVTANSFIIFFLLALSSSLWLLILGICKTFTMSEVRGSASWLFRTLDTWPYAWVWIWCKQLYTRHQLRLEKTGKEWISNVH